MHFCRDASFLLQSCITVSLALFTTFKMKVLPLLLVLPGLALGVVDQYVDCLDGIYTAISYLTFSGTDATDYYGTACTNKVVVTSMWAAAKMYCTPKQIDLGYKQLDKQCEEYGSVALTPYSEVLPTLTDQYIKSLPVAQYSDIKAGTIFNTSVLISRSLYKAGRDTYVRPHASTSALDSR